MLSFGYCQILGEWEVFSSFTYTHTYIHIHTIQMDGSRVTKMALVKLSRSRTKQKDRKMGKGFVSKGQLVGVEWSWRGWEVRVPRVDYIHTLNYQRKFN